MSNPENEKYLADFVEKARFFDSPMATTTRYHLLPENSRPSEDESGAENERRVTPSIHNDPTPPKVRFHISGPATIYTRFAVICLLIPAFVILIMPGTPQTLPIEIFGMICVVRNSLVLLSNSTRPCFRIRVELVGRSPSLPIAKSRPFWFATRSVGMAIDFLIWIPLFVSSTVIGSAMTKCSWPGSWYACDNRAFVPGIVLTWIACALYLVSIVDGGMPSSLVASAGLTYDEEEAPGDDLRSMLVHGGLGVGTKTRNGRADSPVLV